MWGTPHCCTRKQVDHLLQDPQHPRIKGSIDTRNLCKYEPEHFRSPAFCSCASLHYLQVWCCPVHCTHTSPYSWSLSIERNQGSLSHFGLVERTFQHGSYFNEPLGAALRVAFPKTSWARDPHSCKSSNQAVCTRKQDWIM